MRLFIVRHADPDYPNNTITPAGHLEAQALVPRMVKLAPDRLYSSPLGRAIHTGEYSAKALGMTMGVEDWTQEIPGVDIQLERWGPWGKMVAWDVPGELIRGQLPLPTYDTWQRQPWYQDNKVIAAFEAIKKSSDSFLARHGYVREGGRYRIEQANKEKIVIFCHGGFGLTWLAHLLEIPLAMMWSGFWLAPTSVTTILFDQRSPQWAVPRCIGLCDTSHLYAAGLPVCTHGIKANCE